jgi:hypothetical protein
MNRNAARQADVRLDATEQGKRDADRVLNNISDYARSAPGYYPGKELGPMTQQDRRTWLKAYAWGLLEVAES